MANTSKFREAALKQFTSPEQLDQLIQVVTPRSWIIAGSLYAILFILLLWSIFGSIPTRVEGPGILLAGGGDIYNAVAPDGPSHVNSINVKPGDRVVKDQVVATLSRPDLLEQITDTKKYLTDLQDKKQQLIQISNQEIQARQAQLTQQKESLQRVLAASNEKFNHLAAFLALRESAYKRGIETKQDVEQTLQDYYNVKSEIEGYTKQLIQVDIDAANFNDQWHERLRDLDLKITDEKLKLANLQTRLNLSSDVQSPITGIVTNTQVAAGSIVNTGAPLVSIASEGQGLDALVYLPPENGKRIKSNMTALVSPTTVEKAEYGSIQGIVIEVSAFPTTSEAILAALQNQALVKEFSGEKAPIEVRIKLLNNPKTYSGLKWSSSKGPKQQITPGTIVKAMITIQTQAPITLLIPALKKLAGIE